MGNFGMQCQTLATTGAEESATENTLTDTSNPGADGFGMLTCALPAPIAAAKAR